MRLYALLPRLMATITRAPRYAPELNWHFDDSLSFKAFRLWELIFGRRWGIKGEQVSYKTSDGRDIFVSRSWENLIVHNEVMLRRAVKHFFKTLRLPRIVVIPQLQLAGVYGIQLPTDAFRFAIAFDSADTGTVNATPGSTQNQAHTVTGSNPLLWAGTLIRDNDDLSGMTFNSVTMTIGHATDGKVIWNNGVNSFLYLYRITGQTGAHNITASYSPTPATRVEITGSSYSGCEQTTVPDAHGSTADTGGGASISVTLTVITANSWLMTTAASGGGTSSGTNATILTNLGGAGSMLTADSAAALGTGSRTATINNSGGTHLGMITMSFSPPLPVTPKSGFLAFM